MIFTFLNPYIHGRKTRSQHGKSASNLKDLILAATATAMGFPCLAFKKGKRVDDNACHTLQDSHNPAAHCCCWHCRSLFLHCPFAKGGRLSFKYTPHPPHLLSRQEV